MSDAEKEASDRDGFERDERYRPTPDPTLAIVAPELRRLHGYWRTRAGPKRPRREDIDPVEIGADLPHVILLNVAHDPLRFQWRLIGGHIVDVTGRNMTGRRFESIYEGHRLIDVVRVFSRCAVSGLPVRHEGRASYAGLGHLVYESVHLPLFAPDGRVEMILGGLVFQLELPRSLDEIQPVPSNRMTMPATISPMPTSSPVDERSRNTT